ncbi:MAG TPA: hypothetical protein PL131_13400 [Methylotenera sp.]|nr:hypothetical protein [Methylotenera sp.]HPN02119.1 hypothetical protein [Methylotenera sp.]
MPNKIKSNIKHLLFTTWMLFPVASFAEGHVTFTTGVDYSSGKYGQSQSTDITYIPLIGKYEFDDTTIKLTVPWVKITGPGDVVGGSGPVVLGQSNRPITTESGLGDIVLSVSQTVAQIGSSKPLMLDLTGKIKFATASESKGLGTGKNDYTISLDAYKSVAHSLTLFGDIGYKVLGDPSGVKLDDVWFSSAGVSYKINPSSSAGMMANIRQATQSTSDPMRELTLFASHKFNAQYKLQGYLSHGYSDATADWGGGMMLGLMF